jgi:hypothetical protein
LTTIVWKIIVRRTTITSADGTLGLIPFMAIRGAIRKIDAPEMKYFGNMEGFEPDISNGVKNKKREIKNAMNANFDRTFLERRSFIFLFTFEIRYGAAPGRSFGPFCDNILVD